MRGATLFERPAQSIGQFQILEDLRLSQQQWVVIGAPVALDALHTDNTPAGGPEAIRGAFPYFDVVSRDRWIGDWNARRAVALREMEPADLGDLSFGPSVTLQEYGLELQHAVSEVVVRGGRPLVLGGEHSLSFFVIQELALQQDGLWIVHFDAHSDIQLGNVALAPLFNGNVMSHIAKLPGVAGSMHIGVREYEYGERADLTDLFASPNWISSSEIQTMPSTLSKMIPQGSPVYLTVDLDVLDPASNPNVAWPAAAGLTSTELVSAVKFVAQNYQLVGADVVELASSSREMNLGALAASRLIMSILTAGLF